MPYTKGTASSFDDLLIQIVTWVTDTTIHGDDAWEVMRHDPWPRGTIFKAKGLGEDDRCYIGMLPLNVQKGISYKNWLYTYENIGKYIVWAANGFNQPGKAFYFNPNANNIIIWNDQYDHELGYVSHDIFIPDVFNNSFKALVFGVFKKYVDEFNWDDQPGSLPINNYLGSSSLYRTGVNLLYDETRAMPAPSYPGTGYPGIGMNYNDPTQGSFDFWLTKDTSHITVIINNHGIWDMAHVGMLIPYHSKTQYPFPAVIATSNSGMFALVEKNDYRILFDYSYNNWLHTRGMPSTATVVNDSMSIGPSQVCLCLPDGRWQYFANYVQQAYSYNCKPAPVQHVGHYIKPAYTSLGGLTNVYPTAGTYQLEPLDLIQDTVDRKNILGRLWRMFCPSREVTQYGEFTFDGKLYLMLPNCWEGRPWYPYISVLPYIIDEEHDITTSDYLQTMLNTLFYDAKQANLLIRLED